MAGKNDIPKNEMDSVRLISLVSMFATSAFQSMGKLANPLTGKVERNLDAAQGSIDMLLMLRNKTRGNLTREEERMLSDAISELQLNFVKEREKPEPPPVKKAEEKTEGKDEKKAEEKGEKKTEKKDEKKEAPSPDAGEKQHPSNQ